MEFEFGIWGILIFGFGIVYLEFGIIGFGILGILIFRVVFVNVHARILVVGFGSHVAVSCFLFFLEMVFDSCFLYRCVCVVWVLFCLLFIDIFIICVRHYVVFGSFKHVVLDFDFVIKIWR